MNRSYFSKMITGILVLALAVGLIPVHVLAAEEVELTAEEVPVGVSDPMLGVQSGVEDTGSREPRSREELLELEGVTLTADGELASINASLLDDLTDEERNILLGGQGVSTYSLHDADPYEDLREQFGLTNEQIEQGIDLHGDLLGLTSELSNLWLQREHLVFSDAQWSDLTNLISAGYTCSQALWGYAAKDILSVELEDMIVAKATEIEADRAQAENVEEDVQETMSEFAPLAGKLGLPTALVEQSMVSMDLDEEAVEEAVRQALQDAYPPVQEEESVATFAAGRTQYTPEEILSRPYAYDQQGNFDVNINTGAYSYTETDLSIPGKNGLDLVLTRQYHSDQARATVSYGDYAIVDENKTAFQVIYRWYEVDHSQTPYKIIRELTDHSRYQFEGGSFPQIPNDEQSVFSLNEIQAALRQKENENLQVEDIYFATDNQTHDPISIAFALDVVQIGTVYTTRFTTYSEDDPYLADEYGLGTGWMLGLSHVRWVRDGIAARRAVLVTSDGQQYPLKKHIASSGNCIENADTDELVFHLCQESEYNGAEYGLYHKDGKVEYFDQVGRNIAIVDRFGNTIKIEYTFEDSSHTKVSQIKITDTMGNIVKHTKATENTSEYISGKNYNERWQLTLNDSVIREYYTLSETRKTYSGKNIHITQLQAVANEAGEVTTYNHYVQTNFFNCVLQPKNRQIKSSTAQFANDSSDIVVALNRVSYPNGGIHDLMLVSNNIASYGLGGYRYTPRCLSIKNLNSADISSNNVEYVFGDYDGLEGIKSLHNGDYFSQVKYRQAVPYVESDGTETVGRKIFYTYSLLYQFNSDGQIKQEYKTSYSAIPSWQESFVTGDTSKQTSWMSRKKVYTYATSNSRKPETVTTTYYDADTIMTTTQSEKYTYDRYGNIRTYKKPNGQIETYTYDSAYSLPLTATLWQDATTKLTTVNTLSADKKSILTTEIKSNDDTVGKTVYRYGSYGQLLAQDDYKDAENYVTTNYSYNYAVSALPTQVSVPGVKTASGTAAAGTPGFVAGTVARKQTYNKRGWLLSQTDANGKTTSYTYDAAGRITKVTKPDGTTQMYSYNVPQRTVTYTDEAGSQWLCKYGKSGKLLSVKDLTSNVVLEERTYDHWDHLLKKVVKGETTPVQTTRYRYDTDGRVIEQDALNTNGTILYQELYQYWGGANKTSKTVNGNTSAPPMETLTYQDNMGNTVKTGIFRNGGEEWDTYAYDYLGNQTQTRTAYSASQNCAYTTSSTYNYAGQVLSTADADGNTVTYTYDWLGNQLTQRSPKDQNTDPNKTKYPTVYTYDALDRLARVETPLAAGHTGRTDYTYDANGNVIQERTSTGPKNSVSARNTYYTYDSMGRVTQVKGNAKQDGQSGTDRYQYTNYTYDTLGNIKSMSVGNGMNWETTQYTYDRYSRLLTQKDPLGQTQSYTYDRNGLLTSKTDRRGVTTTNTYDAMGRLIQSKAGTDTMSFTYGKTGLRATATINGQTTTYTYNDAGELIKEVTPVATKAMTYGVGGLRKSFTVTANGKTYLNNQYTYNKLGQLTEVTSGNVNAHYSYDSNGNLANVSNGNGTTASYTYNKADLVTEIKNKQGKTDLSNFKYTYGADGNQLTKTDVTHSVTTNYTYDGLNRLTQETQTGAGAFTNTYTYDDFSNRSQAVLAGATTRYFYDANNRLLTSSGDNTATSYTYDAQGNMTRADLTVSGDTALMLYCTYDGFNRLKEVGDKDSKMVYTYDADGLRTSKKGDKASEQYVYDGDQLVVTIGQTELSSFTMPASGNTSVLMPELIANKRYYAVINGRTYSAVAKYVMGETDYPVILANSEPDSVNSRSDERPEIPPVTEDNRILLEFGPINMEMVGPEYPTVDGNRYVHVVGTANASVQLYDFDPSAMSSTVSYVRGLGLIAAKEGNTPTYYHYNAHGDVVQLTDATGAVIKDYTYDAFGVEQNASDTDTNPFRYCGEQYDAETGNYYLRARYYTPGTGRFGQEDPVMDGLNWYTYCGGNPVRFVDPSGRYYLEKDSDGQVYAVIEYGDTLSAISYAEVGDSTAYMKLGYADPGYITVGQYVNITGIYDRTHPIPTNIMLSKTQHTKGDSGLIGVSDEEVSRRARDNSLSGEERRRYQREEKLRGNRNKQKRKSHYSVTQPQQVAPSIEKPSLPQPARPTQQPQVVSTPEPSGWVEIGMGIIALMEIGWGIFYFANTGDPSMIQQHAYGY